MKNLLIIGGSKFAGKSFVNYFNVEKKYKDLNIIIISRKKNKNIKKIKNIKFIKKDFKNIRYLPECDFIFYCLRTSSLRSDTRLFKLFAKKIIKLKKKPKIIFTSSGVLYGLNNKKIKITERNKISIKNTKQLENYKKRWFRQKLNLENLFYSLSKKKFKIVVLRMFSFIGPSLLGQNYASSDFIKSSKQKKNIIINGSVNTYRSYLYEKDFVEWIIKIFYKFDNSYEIFNFGSDKPITLYNLANKIRNYFKSNDIILLNNSKKVDYYVPSIDKLKKKFKLKINVNLNKAILKSIIK